MGTISIIFMIVALKAILALSSEILEYKLEEFPKNLVALHMPCEESNMFATKCMCHLKCTDAQCSNARRICEKYKSKGCKYILYRGGANRIATLKRTPLPEESKSFDISYYPKDMATLARTKYPIQDTSKRVLLKDLITQGGALAQQTVDSLAKPRDHDLCGKHPVSLQVNQPPVEDAKRKVTPLLEGISVVALSYHAPMTLTNSMRTWNQSSFLDLVDEKIAFLNDPYPQEIAVAKEHGFKVLQPKDIPNGKMSKPNVMTIGAAFYQVLKTIRNEYLLFLENDFKMDTSMSKQQIIAELVGAIGMLESGVEVVRLQSRRWQGCGTFKSCDHNGIHLDSPDMMERRRNWFAFYCRGMEGTEKFVADCLDTPEYRCFTSWDSNWTLNAVLVKKSTMMNNKYPTGKGMKTVAEIGGETHQHQDGFESTMSWGIKWMQWKMPVCISYQGLFIHEEIETGH